MKLTLDSLPMYCTECGDCLRWNLATNNTGYPQATIDARGGQMVRRYVFTALMGRTVPRGHVVATKCGDKLCLAPDHMAAMSRGTVLERSYASGKRLHSSEYAARLAVAQRRWQTRMDWDKVRDIRSRPAGMTHAELALEFGVSQRCISDIRRGETWRTAHPMSSVFAWRPAA